MKADDRFPPRPSEGIAAAVVHALAWLVVVNSIGVTLAVLLLFPGLSALLGEWTYGRWMMVHMNVSLFGWCSMPMVAFLFRVYGADCGALASWCRPVVWLWSAALVVGSFSWLSGHSSGKLFLDWSGYARVFFPLALFALWLFLAVAFARNLRPAFASGWAPLVSRAAGLLVLLAVPFAIYFASSPGAYPFVNPDTGGPTGQSQLESSLGIVLILLALPFGLAARNRRNSRSILLAWLVFAAEALLCAALGRSDVSHRVLAQWLSLGSLLAWIPLIPAYYNAFAWHSETRRWRIALLWWWTGLVITGWIFFLPGVLDRFKFTDGLVGHSLTAVAGFLTAFVIFSMAQLMGGESAWIFNRAWSFYAWNLGVLAYVVVMTITGWIEGANPEFTIVPGLLRNLLYSVRLVTGLAMLAGSLEWLVAALSRSASPVRVEFEAQGVKVA
jgi:cytochrome c oxidase cbb3-type subunit 1